MAVSDMQTPIILGSDRATQPIIAPVQESLVADRAYAVGRYFIFNNGMYKVTSAIAQGAAIVIGTSEGCNAEPSSSVMEEKASQIIEVGAETDNEWSRCIVFDNGFKYMWGVKKNLNFAGDTAINLPASFKDTSYFSAPTLTFNPTALLIIQNIIAVNKNVSSIYFAAYKKDGNVYQDTTSVKWYAFGF